MEKTRGAVRVDVGSRDGPLARIRRGASGGENITLASTNDGSTPRWRSLYSRFFSEFASSTSYPVPFVVSTAVLVCYWSAGSSLAREESTMPAAIATASCVWKLASASHCG